MAAALQQRQFLDVTTQIAAAAGEPLKGGNRRRTRRHHAEPRRTRKATLPPLASTMPSISAWYKNLFDRLGWAVLAKAQGKTYRVAAYKKSIASFLQTANHVGQEYENHNRQHDLNVFRLHVRALQDYTNRHL
jgi:hypothetical protein